MNAVEAVVFSVVADRVHSISPPDQALQQHKYTGKCKQQSKQSIMLVFCIPEKEQESHNTRRLLQRLKLSIGV